MKNIICSFEYCVYNKNDKCILDEIEINLYGMCDFCELVTISTEELDKNKQKRLKEIEKY